MSIIQHTSAIILAAGKGTRLNNGQPSEKPKVMHEICGKPMLEYTLKTLENINITDVIIVVGYKAEMIREYFGNRYKYADQAEQKGTGHAVMCAEGTVDKTNPHVLVIQGDDSSFYSPTTIIDLIGRHVSEKAKLSLLTLKHPKPAELGRIIRNDADEVVAIKEKEVLTEEEKKINEINTGTYCFESAWLWDNIKKLLPSATGKGELILPDLVKMAVDQKKKISAHRITDQYEWVGVNDPAQLAYATRVMEERLKKFENQD
ncbi:MAG: sugar phosphate nucleotidyltransferase [Patescibacteria group bacterium]|jgi:bifunctional UDP-N-acetylglucosamine pyrophosphorylase/glucosamine-1-phosphate N-acetyltransferase